jgi:HEAT repeat protein
MRQPDAIAKPRRNIVLMPTSRANEIPELIRRLGSRKPSCVDAARARLAGIGPRAVDPLIEALEGGEHRIRARVMPLLALIQDPRGRGPLAAMLLDRSSRLREVAARCLSRFPSAEAVAALERALEQERSEKVKVAAAEALVELYAAGEDRALCTVIAVLSDSGAARRVRLAALSLLAQLRPSVREGILGRLVEDGDEVVRLAAREVADRGAGGRSSTEIASLVAGLASKEYGVWNAAVHRLAASGADAVQPLLDEMQCRAHDPEYCTRAGMALKAMGRRRARKLADALDRIEEPLPLQVLVEVVGSLEDKAQVYRLKDLIDRMAARPRHPVEANGWDPLHRVRAKAHLELARIGSRVAIEDLREALADPERRIELELLDAVGLIGKREEIGVLLRAYDREDAFVRGRIAHVVESIRKRERLRRDSGVFRRLSQGERRALDEILPRPGRRAAGPREPGPA